MGKGDIKSRKGKINKSSYGNARPKSNRKAAYVEPTEEAKKIASEAKKATLAAGAKKAVADAEDKADI